MAAEDDTGFLSRWSRRKVALRQGALPPDPAPPQHQPPAADMAQPLPAMAPSAPSTLPSPPMSVDAVEAVGSVKPISAGAVQANGPTEPTRSADPPPTLAEADALTPASDFRRFVAPGVDSGVKNAALKKLFTDPHFNLMDGLDTYIDDYGKPDPLPLHLLGQMVQGKFLGLFADDVNSATGQTAATVGPTTAAGPAESASPAALPTAAAPRIAAPTDPSTPPDEDADLRLQPHAAAGREGAEPGAGQDVGRQH